VTLHSSNQLHSCKQVEPTFEPRRGRPTAEQSAAIEYTILSSAKQLMLGNGFDGTSMESVAKSAGVPKSTLYNRFPDKYALLNAVIGHCISDWGSQASRHKLDDTDDLRLRLQQRARNFLNWAVSEDVRTVTRLIDSVRYGKNADRAKDAVTELYDIGHSFVHAAFARDFVEIGGESAASAELIAETYLAMLTGWYLNRSSQSANSPKNVQRYIEHATEVLLHGREAW